MGKTKVSKHKELDDIAEIVCEKLDFAEIVCEKLIGIFKIF